MKKTKAVIAVYKSDRLVVSAKDRQCHKIFEKHKGAFVATGWVIPDGTRDIEYDVPERRVKACKAELEANGFTVNTR